jgi:uncharacterized membrane protein
MQTQPIILCIPRLAKSITREYIFNVIEKMQIGEIETLHEIPLQKSSNFKRIIIRVKWDLSSPKTQKIYSQLSENKSIKIVHNMPWYWICVKYVKQGPKEIRHGLDQSLLRIVNEKQ